MKRSLIWPMVLYLDSWVFQNSSPFLTICSSSSCNLSMRLAPTATLIPAFDNAREVAYPIPLLAPVTIATLLLFSNILAICEHD